MEHPERIGRYRIERVLGAGSFATVWLGHDEVLDARVAIKVLAENWSHDLRVRERFVEEARLLWRLEDDHLVRVHAFDELPDGRPYVVLGWADGGSLRDRLESGPLEVELCLWLLAQIASGVQVLHDAQIVHRDLTPGNVLFRNRPTGPQQVLVADLGLAKELAATSGLTARAGTPGFMAPEQDHPLATVDRRTDVYALGRLGVVLLTTPDTTPDTEPDTEPDLPSDTTAEGPTGARADVGDAPAVTVGAVEGRRRLRRGVPSAVAAVLRTATAQDPESRYADAEAFATALAEAIGNRAPGAAGGGPVTGSPAGSSPAGDSGERHRPGRAAARDEPDSGAGARPPAPAPESAPEPAPASSPLPAPRRSRRRRVVAAALVLLVTGAATTVWWLQRDTSTVAVDDDGRVRLRLPAGWEAAGSGWSGRPDGDGVLEPALVVSPDPGRWADDDSLPGAFIGLSPSLGSVTTPEAYIAEQVHGQCDEPDSTEVDAGGVTWTVATFAACRSGKPTIVEAAGSAPSDAGLLYVQIAPPASGDPASFVESLLAGVEATTS
ncbi:serine/threonine-protein kinase [Myceligenerans indicum]|uniref:non-specific serine/threonine protein kinase n=1 Tax=Myceligenerans indicum TaxID=2593663 RepID=A0ABS1LK22_9MICO|nr:serine/threonine-protein kinase [Myceligenerans indicum]MBL0886561.1 serine/threonine protein kinase [Myceligenerans indicum]